MIFSSQVFQGLESLIDALGANNLIKSENRTEALVESSGIDPEAFSNLLFRFAEDNLTSGNKYFETTPKLSEKAEDKITNEEIAATASFLMSSITAVPENAMPRAQCKNRAEFGSVREILAGLIGDPGGKDPGESLIRAISEMESENTPSRFELASLAAHLAGKVKQDAGKELPAGGENKVESNIVKSLNSLFPGTEGESMKSKEKHESVFEIIRGVGGKLKSDRQMSNIGPKVSLENGYREAPKSGHEKSGGQSAFPVPPSNNRQMSDSSFPEHGQTGIEVKTGGAEAHAGNRNFSPLLKEESVNEIFGPRNGSAAKPEIVAKAEETNGEKSLNGAGIQKFDINYSVAKESGTPNASAVVQAPLHQNLHENIEALKTQTKLPSFFLEKDSLSSEANVANQVFVRLFTGLRQGARKMVIDLQPPEVGRVKVDILSDKNGIRVRMCPQNEQMVGLLEKHLPMLQHSLENQGVSISSLQVGAESGNNQTFQFQGYGFGSSGGNSEKFRSPGKKENSIATPAEADDIQEGTGSPNGLSLRV